VRRLYLAHPEVAKVILLDTYDRDIVVSAFRSGARGLFCFSQHPFGLLCKCIHSVHRGQVWANSEQMQFVIESLSQVASLHMVNSRGIRHVWPAVPRIVRVQNGYFHRDRPDDPQNFVRIKNAGRDFEFRATAKRAYQKLALHLVGVHNQDTNWV
jgi:hypothetical protein